MEETSMIQIDRRLLLSGGLPTAAIALLGGMAHADAYPGRNVRVIVPFSAGGTTDFVARVVADKMSELAGQRFFVENRTGASGMVGLKEVAGAAPDGYTLAVTDTSIAIAPSLSAKAGVSPAMFEPVCLIATFPSVMVVHPSVPAGTVAELIAYARSNPGKVNFGSGGIGTGPHLQGEMFKAQAKIDIQHVAYRGAASALQDVVAGNIQLLFTAAPTAMAFIRGGQLKLLATTGAARLPIASAAPTMVEAGLKDFVSEQWFGLLAPAKTPGDVLARANALAAQALTDPVVAERILDQGGFPKPGTPAEYASFIDREVKAWGDIVAAANIVLP
jgi:tripartite-type tricarboxylate transporter receptor subunit TctC